MGKRAGNAFGGEIGSLAEDITMARTLARLSAVKLENLGTPGMHADAGGLYLQVAGDAAKRLARF